MSMITTAVPTGVIKTDWCMKEIDRDFFGSHIECANATLGQKPADFETICCDGDIVNTSKDLYAWLRTANRSWLNFDLEDLVCCGVHEAQQGGFGPPVNLATACTAGRPTPLTRLAATNTSNAVPYRVTYTSASYGETTTGDFIPTETPTCLWMYTKTGVSLVNITIPAAQITSPPPATTDKFGFPITTASASDYGAQWSSHEASLSAQSAAATASASPTSAASIVTYRRRGIKSTLCLLFAVAVCIT